MSFGNGVVNPIPVGKREIILSLSPPAAPLAAKAAAEKSVSLLQTNVDSFFAKSNCVACHHQPARPASPSTKNAST